MLCITVEPNPSTPDQPDQKCANPMKKYPFPPNVRSMSDSDYREHCATMSKAAQEAKTRVREDKAAAAKIRETRRTERASRIAARAARIAEVRATSPSGRITALAVGESVTLTGYKTTPQISASIRHVYVRTGQRYTSALARDMLTGESVIGVTVTRVE